MYDPLSYLNAGKKKKEKKKKKKKTTLLNYLFVQNNENKCVNSIANTIINLHILHDVFISFWVR